MKKYCLLIISILCLCIFFTGCSVPDEPPVDTVLQDGANGTRIIDEVFKKTFNVENINDYVLQDVYAGSDFVIYEAYKKDAEKEKKFFGTGDLEFKKEATGEFDRFDYLLFRDNKLTSLIDELDLHTFNYFNVEELFEKHKVYIVPATTNDLDKAWVETKAFELRNIGIINENSTNMPLEGAAYLYELNNWDYDWIVLYSEEKTLALNDCIFMKYTTLEQKESLLNSIEYRLDAYLENCKFEEYKKSVVENQRLYIHNNMIVWFTSVDWQPDTTELLDTLFADSERIR